MMFAVITGRGLSSLKRGLLAFSLTSIYLSVSSLVHAADDFIMIESTITGSQEQPKVISIVPWKSAKDPDYIGEDLVGLGEPINVFQTLDRVRFNRERLYIQSTRPSHYSKKR